MKRAILSAMMFATVAFAGTSSGYIGFNTAQPMWNTQAIQSGDVAMSVSQPYQYSTEPVMQQLQTQPITSNFGQLDAFPNAAVLAQQGLLYNAAIMGEPKPVPLSFTQPMIDAAMLSQQLPYQQAISAPLAAAFPQSKSVKPIKEFKYVNAPITSQFEALPVKELPNIIQHYAVPSTFTTQENIKQPITQPVWQPYLQRYEQRAVPVVQPIVNRVVQPVIHRQLHPFLTSQTVQGQQEQAIINAPKVLDFNNQAIVGSELDAQPLENRSEVPKLPVMGAATATKK